MASDAQLRRENRVVIAHVYTSTAAIALGAVFGVFQGFARTSVFGAPAWFDYYRILTLHGVLMALVFTTFFITGLSLFVTYRSIPRARSLTMGWFGWWLMVAGTAMAAVTILMGDATVLYTFYAPLKASPWFYVGATLLILGTWVVAFEIFENVAYFRRNNPGAVLPLVVFGAAATFLMWLIATLGVVAEMGLLIPWAFGWTKGIDVMLTRMFFWYFGHPLVYFWIMGAYLIWYNIIPTRYGGNTFSDALTRLTFIMLLLLSTPVGIHHEFMEPGISSGWKMLHTLTTYGVAIPSFITAFAIFASFELAALARGKRGFIATVASLPWNDPVFSGAGLGMILFIIGGFGGLVNASYSMDTLVHNTIWIVGHFHVTVGGPVALSFLGAAYWMIPRLTGRALWKPEWALFQTRLWFFGMLIMSFSMHFAGLLGAPRRTAEVGYMGAAAAQAWQPLMLLAAAGGFFLFASIITFAIVAIGTLVQNEKTEPMDAVFATPADAAAPTPGFLQHLYRWGAVAIVLAVLAYVGPLGELLRHPGYLAPGMRTW
ncbi:MAG: cbb3-type cytochrome c oxidase subunit I [Candidatus Eremiobacteraeota bacterium]|nr:cbb3-type cytochrome c oxidase subunit I [Candidatus Eremiobacteraeota bacterium]MBV8331525.1 cbb3-type cytochrome c oxidase subunit I [Candidatus Eremiobacteraeota bacterium]MBV8433871.1 cbb3-type cytochrome c oxidase subunit I [Candidatus Eremiobacteraeota bacterium]